VPLPDGGHTLTQALLKAVMLLLESSLNGAAQIDRGYEVTDPAVLGRVGCWVSDGVRARTTVALLRLRHQLVSGRGRRETTLLVEEATGLAWVGQAGNRLAGTDALALLTHPPADDVPPPCARARGGPGPGLARRAGGRA
jgi:hypothetical protein